VFSPLTGKSDVQRIATYSPKIIAEKWKYSMGVDVGADFRSLPTIEYWKCLTTGLGWYAPPQAAGKGELYSQLETFNWYYMPDKWEFDVALGLLEPGEHVLEVGVGFGHFLRAARNQGVLIDGVELNPSAAELARSQGFEIYKIDLAHLSSEIDMQYDAICSFQVLEHVADPGGFLRDMLKNLRPGGRLILSVPNAAVIRKIDPNNQNLLNQPPHHMSHWDSQVFRALENFFPVKVRSVHRESLANYHIAWFVTGYLRSLFSGLSTTANRVLFNKYSTAPICWLIKIGLNKWIPGHTLLVELEKKI